MVGKSSDRLLFWLGNTLFAIVVLVPMFACFLWHQLDDVQNITNEKLPIYRSPTPPGAIGHPNEIIGFMEPNECFEIKDREGNSDFVRYQIQLDTAHDEVGYLFCFPACEARLYCR